MLDEQEEKPYNCRKKDSGCKMWFIRTLKGMDCDMLALFWLVVIAALLCIKLCLSREAKELAEIKGHHDKNYFWYCFLRGVYGYIRVLMLPDLSAKNGKEQD